MYCLPCSSKVIGVDCALAGSSDFHTSSPVEASKARSQVTMAAAVNTRPPAVDSGPPRLGEPLLVPGINSPSGASQRSLPAARSKATNAPHGGALQGTGPGDIRYSRLIT